MSERRNLSWFSVAIGLLGLHYGTGFLIGTGEKVYVLGPSGSLYAVSASLGLLCLAFYAPLYHRLRDRIELLMAHGFGERKKSIGDLVGFLSWLWMVGTTGAQIMGVTYVVTVWQLSDVRTAMFAVSFLTAFVSSLDLRKIIWVFRYLIAISTVGITVSLILSHSSHFYVYSIRMLVPSYLQVGSGEIIGIGATTILLTMIGMDFHQFIVRARRPRDAVIGCVFAALLLFLMAFLPTSAALAAKNMGLTPAEGSNGKTILALFLLSVERSINIPGAGILLVMALLGATLNSAAGLNRAMAITLRDFVRSYLVSNPTLHARLQKMPLAAFAFTSATIALGIALLGKTIIGVIVAFYAFYVAGIFNPFVAFILHEKNWVKFSANAIVLSMFSGTATALLIWVAWVTWGYVPFTRVFLGNVEFAMTGLGLFVSSIPLIMEGAMSWKTKRSTGTRCGQMHRR